MKKIYNILLVTIIICTIFNIISNIYTINNINYENDVYSIVGRHVDNSCIDYYAIDENTGLSEAYNENVIKEECVIGKDEVDNSNYYIYVVLGIILLICVVILMIYCNRVMVKKKKN